MARQSEASKRRLAEEARRQTERRQRRERSRAARKGWETRWRRGDWIGAKGERFIGHPPAIPSDWWEHEAPLHDAIGEVGGVRKEYPIRRK